MQPKVMVNKTLKEKLKDLLIHWVKESHWVKLKARYFRLEIRMRLG